MLIDLSSKNIDVYLLSSPAAPPTDHTRARTPVPRSTLKLQSCFIRSLNDDTQILKPSVWRYSHMILKKLLCHTEVSPDSSTISWWIKSWGWFFCFVWGEAAVIDVFSRRQQRLWLHPPDTIGKPPFDDVTHTAITSDRTHKLIKKPSSWTHEHL